MTESPTVVAGRQQLYCAVQSRSPSHCQMTTGKVQSSAHDGTSSATVHSWQTTAGCSTHVLKPLGRHGHRVCEGHSKTPAQDRKWSWPEITHKTHFRAAVTACWALYILLVCSVALLFLVCMSWTVIGQPGFSLNSIFICRVHPG